MVLYMYILYMFYVSGMRKKRKNTAIFGLFKDLMKKNIFLKPAVNRQLLVFLELDVDI